MSSHVEGCVNLQLVFAFINETNRALQMVVKICPPRELPILISGYLTCDPGGHLRN